MTKHQVFEITNKRIYFPYVTGSTIQAGFPSPAAEYEEIDLDINDIVVSNTAATFFVRVKSDFMIDANVNDGDILVTPPLYLVGNAFNYTVSEYWLLQLS